MRYWQVQIYGKSFIHNGKKCSFELDGIVSAPSVSEAFTTAVHLAKQQYPELKQAEHPPGFGPVINPEEINEISDAPERLVGQLEIYWQEDK